MRTFLLPAIGLMNRLRFTGKFALMLLVLSLSIGLLVTSLYRALNVTIVSSQRELDAIVVVKPLLQAVQMTQQHRGLSAAVVGGNTGMASSREAKAREVAQLLQVVEPLLTESLRRGEAWQAARADWARIETDGLQLDVSANVAAHTALIGRLLRFLIQVADEFELTLDPEAGSYYLMDTAIFKLPTMLETLGRMRAMGSGVLAAHRLDPKQAISLNIFLAELDKTRADYELNLDKTANANPAAGQVLKASAGELGAAMRDLGGVVRDDILSERFATPSQQYYQRATQAIDAGYRQLYDAMLPTLGRLVQERIDRLNANLRLNVAVIAIVLLLTIYLAAGMYFAIVENVGLLSEGAGRIAAGDLTARIRITARDELLRVADSFNRMAEAVNETVRNVRGNADRVLDAARRTAESSSQIAISSDSQSQSASSMAAAVEQTTVGIDHITRNAHDAREISRRSGELSADGGKLVQTVVAEMREISTAVSASAQSVEDLGRRSDEISAIVGVIREIADQTNLLALNAAIEAARAGEQGRGFAVVADEVRKLAERTGQSTQEIGEMIASIQGETRLAVDNMKIGVDRVARGVELSSRAGDSMAEISAGAAQVVEVVREISEALAEQSSASADIARNVETIAQMAEQNSAAVGENHATVAQLEQLARDLQNEVARFRVA
ncbi:MAG: methyl-accepting chemotaxis protein [Rhodocyclales bacterium]|nr:methyl-accepting chemotaxis protein [Rhodocyclales bacterium]